MANEIELAKRYTELEIEKRRLDDELKEVRKQQGQVEELLLREMETSQTQSMSVGGYTIYKSHQVAAKCADREAATPVIQEWYPELLKYNFNMNSLSAIIRERYRDFARSKGGSTRVDEFVATLPESVQNVLEIRNWQRIAVRKAN